MDLDVDTVRVARSREDLALAPGEVLLGGGTFLFSEPVPDGVTGLVDLTGMGWEPWTIDGAGLRVAATCTIEQLREGPGGLGGSGVPGPYPGLAIVRACTDALLLSFKVAHSATVGGNVCLALPAGAMVSLFAALGGSVVVWTPGGGARESTVVDLVTGAGRTTLAPGEVLREVRVPASALGARTAFRKAALTALGRSSAVVTAAEAEPAEAVRRVRLVLTASVPRPVELTVPAGDHAALDAVLDRVTDWYDDPHGTPVWRAAMTRRLAHEVLEELG
ncbi:FAD binding domain-containing protein [Antribacter sp. KLBMP9083]|uniref:FAD binding domain-containing protein n=1 Tax=Antribacter soli TaxID=2910976 RepID=A0AA41QK62_9MICO|nr:FAD binding domain-containing protein [Antribacter soli]MCF4123549.1 FAD binding domain-containing protein [Antribacter soli]